MVASTLYYWLPPEVDAVRGVRKLPAGTWAEYHRDGTVSGGTYWDTADEAARAARGTAARPRRTSSRTPSAPTWSRTCPWRRSSAEASTRAS